MAVFGLLPPALAQLPAGWGDGDVGAVAIPGSASFSGGTWTVIGNGSDIWNSADEFHFAFNTLVTNYSVIVARITAVQNTDTWAKAGVMFRDNLDPSAPFAMVVATPGNGVNFQYRTDYAGQCGGSAVGGINPPFWVKLVRNGNDFAGYYSPNGSGWTPIGPSQTVLMADVATVGLAVCSHNLSQTCAATFTGVTVTNMPAPPPPPPVIFGVYRELWNGLNGSGTLSELTNTLNNPNWPDNPAAAYTKVFTNFETEVDFMDAYGQRVRTFVVPPVSGNYTFWIASDDNSELYLSTNESLTNKTRIASVPGWTNSREWTKYPQQQSAPIALEGGRRYYLEALMAEGGGGDNLAVRWQLPGGNIEEPLTATTGLGTFLVPYDGVDVRPGVYQQTPTNLTVIEGSSPRLSVLVTNRSSVSYQWTLGAANLNGAILPFYTITNVTVAGNNNQVYRCVVTNSAGFTNCAPITLKVIADTNPPTIVRTLNVGTTNVQVVFSEAVEAASATNKANYVFTNALAVTGAVLSTDNISVMLTTSPLVYGSNYSIVINKVRDRASTPNTIATNTTVRFTALPYATQDVGSPPIATVITLVSNGVNVMASGNDVGGYADQFGFSYTVRTGNFDVAARLAGLSLPDIWAKAALMARETLDPGSRFAASVATPAINGCFFEWRDPANAFSGSVGSFPANYPYTWLRLKRLGNTFTGYAGYDGVNWMPLGSNTIAMASQLYFGLAVSSHNGTQPAQAQFRDMFDVTNATVGLVVAPHEKLGPSSRKTPVVFSEIMYKPAPRTDTNNLEFIEIYNSNPWFHDISGYTITGGNMTYTFPAGTIIQAGSFMVIAASPDNMQTVYGITGVKGPYAGSLQVPDTLQLWDEHGALLLTVNYGNEYPWPVAADGTGHSLVLANPTYGEADPRAWDISDSVGGSPGQMDSFRPSPLRNVVINEWLAHTDPPDWDYIELYNHANQAVDISGCTLSDKPNTNKFVIPQGTVIPARGFVYFSETNMPFSLSAAGESLYFKNPDSTRVLDAVHFGGQENGVSSGRWPDGAPEFYRLAAKTPGTNNGAIKISNIVINELMYHPISGNDDDQYVELYNRGATSVNLTGWELNDGITFNFPSNTIVAPDGYLVVARNAARLRTNYANLNLLNCLGDFKGKLSHGGDRVTLRMADTIASTNSSGVITTNLIHITVNDVSYGTSGRWGQWSDGGGSSLELIDPNSNNRLAANWGDSDDSAKSAWANVEVTGVLDNGANYEPAINHAQIGLLDSGECLVDNVEVRTGTTGNNLVLNPDFEVDLSNWSMQGDHARSTQENTGYGGSSHSLHIRASSRIWTGDNSCQMNLAANPLGDGSTATLRFKARWLHGTPEILMRLNGNWLEAAGMLPLPANLGTPGARNSRYAANAGPALYAVTHYPPLPAAGQSVVITAKVHDPDAVGLVQVFYRLDPTVIYSSVAMRDDGTGGDAIAGDGIYSATITASNTLVAFYVSAQDTRGATTRFPALRNNFAAAPEALIRFGDPEPPGSFPVYHLWVTQTNRQRWFELSDLSNEEHDCTMVSGNRVIYNVLARFAGSPYHQGFDYPDGNLCHYKWTFPDDDKFLGATSFNKIHQPGNGAGDDTSIQREQLANTFLRTLGVPWLYRHHVAVYVNGNRRGTLMEDAQTPDADVVEEHFPNDQDGWLYKMQPWFEFDAFPQGIQIPFNNASWCNLMPYTTTGGAKKTARYRYMFLTRRTATTASDYTNVFSLVDAATSYGTPNYVANMENLADMENWMRVFAANHAAGNWDAFGCQNSQNLYGYIGTKGTKYSLLMFDFNIVIGNSGSWGPGQNLFSGNGQDPNVLNIYNEPTFRRMYWRALNELVKGPLDVNNSGALLDAKYNAFAMNGISVEDPNAAIKTWLTSARTSIAAQLDAVNATNFTLDAGYTLSNNVAWFTGTAPVDARSVFINGAEYPLTWTSLTQFRVGIPLQAGNNNLSFVGVDIHNQPIAGTTNNVSINYTGTVPSPVGQVVLSEIMYNGVQPGAEYVELYNKSDVAFDLSNWKFNGLSYIFPPGSTMGPKSYLMLAANAASYTAAYGATAPAFDAFNGSLQHDGETLTLIKPGSTPATDLVIDKVKYGAGLPWPAGPTVPGTSLQLVDLGQDNWRVANWAAGTTNAYAPAQWTYVTASGIAGSSTFYVYLQSAGDIYIDDIKLVSGSSPGVGNNLLPDGDFESAYPGPWTVSTNLTNSTLSSIIKHGGNAALHLVSTSPGSTQASAIWQTISPALVAGQTYSLSFWYLQTTNGGPLTLRLSQSSWNASVNPAPPTIAVPLSTPAFPNSVAAVMPPFQPLWINEIQAQNLTGITNSAGQRTPWIELYNPTTTNVSLNGIVLANNYTNLSQWGFPAAAVINAGQFKTIFADGQTNLSTLNELHAGFTLPSGAGSVALSRITTNGLVQVLDYLNYTNLTPNHSYGSFPDGQAFDRQEFFYASPGGTNIATSPPLTVSINEWMADNVATLMDPADDQYEDWFELYNYGNTTVDLYDYYLTDTITNNTQYHITGHYQIPPKGFLLVWADNDTGQNSTNRPDLHVNFKLAKEGEEIALFAADGTLIDHVTFGPQTTDVSMGRIPDGGSTLSFLSMPTPRTNNVGNTAPILAPISDRPAFLGQTLSFYASATDVDPGQSLSFSLGAGAPAGAAIDPATGLFSWKPTLAPARVPVTIIVTDNGVPPMSASQPFVISVSAPPAISGIAVTGSQFAFGFSTVPGATYQVEFSDNLATGSWLSFGNPIAGDGSVVNITANVTLSTQRFFRVRIQ